MENKSNSSIGKASLVRYKDKDHGLFHFKYVDQNKSILVESGKGYRTAESRDKGIKHVTHPNSSYKIIQKDNQFYFIIRAAGNNAKIAISPVFSTKKDAEIGAESFLSALRSPAKSNTKIKDRKTQKDPLPRHSFRLTFYPSENEDEMVGSIESILNDKKSTFQGLDMVSIQQFLEENLPILSKKMQPKEVEKKVTKTKNLKPPIGKEKEAESKPLELIFLEDGQELKSKSVNHNKTVEMQINMPPNESIPIGNTYEIFVFAKSLKTHEEILTGHIRGLTKINPRFRLPLYFDSLAPGPYQLTTSIDCIGVEYKEEKKSNLKGSSYLLVS